MSPSESRRCPWLIAAALLCVACLARALPAQSGPEDERPFQVAADIVYLEGGDPRLQSLDVYAPIDASRAPVVVYVHGGALKGGDKRQVGDKPAFFCGRGYVLVSINYRLAPAVRHPSFLEDTAAAVAWVHRHIAHYGGDPARIVYLGHSAGALLGGLLITDHRRLAIHGLGLDVLRAAVLLDGHTFNLEGRIREIDDPEILKVPFSKFGNTPEAWRDASAMAHIGAGKGHPPTLLVAAGIQFQHYPPGKAAREFAAALRAAGAEARVFMATDKNHGGVNRDVTSGDEMSRAIMGFFDQYLAAEG
jgi:arylformamidase